MKKIKIIIPFIALALIGFGLVWDIIIYFDNWKYVLSPFGKLSVYWKPSIMILVGFGTLQWYLMGKK